MVHFLLNRSKHNSEQNSALAPSNPSCTLINNLELLPLMRTETTMLRALFLISMIFIQSNSSPDDSGEFVYFAITLVN